jgi:hypothetical protein
LEDFFFAAGAAGLAAVIAARATRSFSRCIVRRRLCRFARDFSPLIRDMETSFQ